jgi:hypothetical protein
VVMIHTICFKNKLCCILYLWILYGSQCKQRSL